MRIIYKNSDNSVGLLVPTDEALKFFTLKQIAEKDVPFGYPYKIVRAQDIPTDRTFRDAWEWNPNTIPDGFGGESNEFDAELLAEYLKGLENV